MAMRETQILDDIKDEERNPIPYQYKITSYGADYTVDMIVKRMISQDIYVPPFQRKFVWNFRQSCQFIESLLLGLPVPGIFLATDETKRKYVIDGHQRLRTLEYFYEGIFKPEKKEFALQNVQKQFKFKTYKTLEEDDKRVLDDSILHATIVKQDEPSEDNSSVYMLFERLNQNVKALQPQEIRYCIYSGKFNEFLIELNKYGKWREIFGNIHSRRRDEELILRFFALLYYLDQYESPMKGFLNHYMGHNRSLKYQKENELARTFKTTIDIVYNALGIKAFRTERRFVAAIFDAVMVGLADRLKKTEKQIEPKKFQSRYEDLLKNKNFINASTSDITAVKQRIKEAKKCFKVL